MRLAILVCSAVLSAALSIAVAEANDVQGRVKAMEMTQKVITLDDGTRLFWTDETPVAEQIQSGDVVRAKYEERGGRLVVTEIEIVV